MVAFRYFPRAFALCCVIVGMTAAQSEAPQPAVASATVSSLPEASQSELADITGKSVDELTAMKLGKEGMEYVCEYAVPPGDENQDGDDSAAAGVSDWWCKAKCAGKTALAAVKCTTVVMCIPGVASSIATCADCPDIICYAPPILAVVGTVCKTGACGALPDGGIQGTCDTVCNFCGM